MSTLTLAEATGYITAQADETELARIVDAVNLRRKTLRALQAAAVTVGATVRIADIRPACLKGLTGTVKAIEGTNATIELDEDSTVSLRWARQNKIKVGEDVKRFPLDRVPLECCKIVA